MLHAIYLSRFEFQARDRQNINLLKVAVIPTELKENFSQQFDLLRLLMHKNFCFCLIHVGCPWANIYFFNKEALNWVLLFSGRKRILVIMTQCLFLFYLPLSEKKKKSVCFNCLHKAKNFNTISSSYFFWLIDPKWTSGF